MADKANKRRAVAKPAKADPLEDIARRFSEALAIPEEVDRPPGSITLVEYAKLSGTTREGARYRILKLERLGRATKTKVGKTHYYTLTDETAD